MTAALPPDPVRQRARLLPMPRFTDPDRVFHYKYSCDDRSMLSPYYKRFICEPFIKLVPRTLHPNWLTTLAAVCTMLAFALTADAFGEFDEMGPWGPIAVAVLILGYITLDNSDGLQARRTKTSSPLGDFLDHFFDAGGVVLIPMMIMVAADMNPALQIVAAAFTAFSFWLVNWEKSHTGTMVIPPVGDVEGNLAAVGWWLTCAALGGPLWNETFFDVKVIDAMHYITIPVFVAFAIAMCFPLYNNREGRGEAVGVMVNLALLAGWGYSTLHFGLTSLFDAPLLILLIGYTCAKHIGDIQRGHLIGAEYRSYDPVLLGLGALLLASVWLVPAARTNDVQLYLGLGYAAVLLAKLAYQLRHTATFISDKLGIKVFSLTATQKENLARD